jgi:AmmeMemoRadiSam system protein A
MEFSDEEKQILLSAARNSIKACFVKATTQKIDYSKFPGLKLIAGAFVTLRIKGELRGCIGYIVSKESVFNTVCEAAKNAAFSDPRFYPVDEDELNEINIEISVLSPPFPINSYDDIALGKHGLVLDDNGIRALLLPQVATENNYNREQFLTAICEKAGIYPFYWKEHKLKLLVFTASVFSEERKEEGKYEYD